MKIQKAGLILVGWGILTLNIIVNEPKQPDPFRTIGTKTCSDRSWEFNHYERLLNGEVKERAKFTTRFDCQLA